MSFDDWNIAKTDLISRTNPSAPQNESFCLLKRTVPAPRTASPAGPERPLPPFSAQKPRCGRAPSAKVYTPGYTPKRAACPTLVCQKKILKFRVLEKDINHQPRRGGIYTAQGDTLGQEDSTKPEPCKGDTPVSGFVCRPYRAWFVLQFRPRADALGCVCVAPLGLSWLTTNLDFFYSRDQLRPATSPPRPQTPAPRGRQQNFTVCACTPVRIYIIMSSGRRKGWKSEQTLNSRQKVKFFV